MYKNKRKIRRHDSRAGFVPKSRQTEGPPQLPHRVRMGSVSGFSWINFKAWSGKVSLLTSTLKSCCALVSHPQLLEIYPTLKQFRLKEAKSAESEDKDPICDKKKKKKKQRIQKLILPWDRKRRAPRPTHHFPPRPYPLFGSVISPYCSSFYICISQLSLVASLNSWIFAFCSYSISLINRKLLPFKLCCLF